MKKNKIALIDGYGFVFRAFHSLPPLTRNDGTPVGAVYGFTNMLIRLLAGLNVTHLSVVFDSGSKTFRNQIYDKYKANRPPCPPELIPQFPLIREVAESLNLHIAEKVGYEADDLIATIAKSVNKEEFDVMIVSSDKDLMQLVDDHIFMFDAMKNKLITKKEVKEKFMVAPAQVLDVLSLMGDSSDNVPGVKGIGPKTAAELINQYGDLENLLLHLDEIKQEKRREILKAGTANALLSKQLITLCETVPIDVNMKDFEVKNIDPHKLIKFLEAQGFRSLMARIQKEFKIDSNSISNSSVGYEKNTTSSSTETSIPNSTSNIQSYASNIIVNDLSFDKIKKTKIETIEELKRIKILALLDGNLIIDTEFNLENSKQIDSLILSSFSNDYGVKEIFYIPIQKEEKKVESFGDLFSAISVETSNQSLQPLNLSPVLTELKEIFLDPSILKIGYKIKDLIKLIKVDQIDDIAVMAYVINSGSDKSNIRNLISTNLAEDIENNGFGTAFDEIEKVKSGGKSPELFSDENKKLQFFCFKSYAIYQLYKFLKKSIFEQKLNFVYYQFDRPLIPVLAEIEMNGILVDKIKLKKLSDEFEEKAKILAKEIYVLAGEEFNIASPKQLSHILFEKLSLKSGKKSKSGGFSTSSDILEELDLEGHIIAGKILDWRHLTKLKNTYTDSLQKQINPETSRVHTTFSAISTSTGRLSSIDPNLQNIPIRSEEGNKIREAFIAAKNHQLISADYSQIELRVLAHTADIGTLKQAFKENKDIHAITAAQVFGVLEKDVDSDMRRKAKAINFGIIYGISAFGLAKQLGISVGDASTYIKTYFTTYPGIQNYMSVYKENARTNGFVATITGRKCFLTDINSNNPVLRGLAERLAINAPIQGSAADIIKKAMIDLSATLKEKNLKTKLILQVHDELILEAPNDEIEVAKNLVKDVMEKAMLLDLPLKVDVEVGNHW